MSVPYGRRLAVGAGIAAGVLLASGCAAGIDAPTNSQGGAAGGPGDGATTAVGDQLGRGLVLVTDAQGRANLVGTLVNLGNDADSVASITVDGASGVTISAGGSSRVALPARTSLPIGQGDGPQVTVNGLAAPIGQFVQVTVNYATAGSASTSVLTVPATGQWAGLGPAAG